MFYWTTFNCGVLFLNSVIYFAINMFIHVFSVACPRSGQEVYNFFPQHPSIHPSIFSQSGSHSPTDSQSFKGSQHGSRFPPFASKELSPLFTFFNCRSNVFKIYKHMIMQTPFFSTPLMPIVTPYPVHIQVTKNFNGQDSIRVRPPSLSIRSMANPHPPTVVNLSVTVAPPSHHLLGTLTQR